VVHGMVLNPRDCRVISRIRGASTTRIEKLAVRARGWRHASFLATGLLYLQHRAIAAGRDAHVAPGLRLHLLQRDDAAPGIRALADFQFHRARILLALEDLEVDLDFACPDAGGVGRTA